MSTVSRPYSPGEVPGSRGGTQNERQFLNRIYLGKIVSVDTDNGSITVSIFGLGQQNLMHIPLHGISVNRTRSSWIRYMPQVGDHVKVGFGPDNYPEVLGYALFGIDPSDSRTAGNPGAYLPRVSGYKQLRRLKERSDAGERPTDPTTGNQVVLGFRDFVPLKQGEWDMRSSGGAYLHGSQFGVLTLSGGQNVVKIDKVKDEVAATSQLFKLDAGNDTFIRLGDIKRAVTGAGAVGEFTASATIPVGLGSIVSTREYHLQISQVLTPTVGGTVPVYEEKLGDVRNDLGLPAAIPLVVSKKAWLPGGAAGIPGPQLYGFSVDNLGTVTLSAPFATGKIVLKGGPIVATTGVTYSAVRAETLNTWLQTQLSVLTAFGPSGPAVAPFPADGGILSPASPNVQIS